MIKVIVFDFAGVVGPGMIFGWVKEHGIQDPTVIEKFRTHSAKWDLGEVTDEEFYELIADITGMPKGAVKDTLYRQFTYFEDTVELIRQLKKYYTIVLLSDNYAPMLRPLLDEHHLTELFDHILISSEYGLKKPDPRFFETLLKTVNAEKNEVVFTDDTFGNIEGAEQFGIRAIHFQNAAQLKKELQKMGVTL